MSLVIWRAKPILKKLYFFIDVLPVLNTYIVRGKTPWLFEQEENVYEKQVAGYFLLWISSALAFLMPFGAKPWAMYEIFKRRKQNEKKYKVLVPFSGCPFGFFRIPL